MIRLRHTLRLLGELLMFSVVNRSVVLLLLALLMGLLALFVQTTHAALPFIYTIF